MRSIVFILAITVAVVFSFQSSDSHAKRPVKEASVTLDSLSCAANEIAKLDGTVWGCAEDDTG